MFRIRFERSRLGLSQSELGKLAQIPQSTVSAIERGRILPTQDELERLARVLNVSPASILIKNVEIMRSSEEESVLA